MNQIQKEKEFQIDKLIKVLSSASKNFVVISGVPEDKTNTIISSIISVCVENKKYIPDWTSFGTINVNDCVNDIRNVILNNLNKNLENDQLSKFTRKVTIPRLAKKVDKLCKYKINKQEEDIKKNTKVVWPVMTTISSFGVALGVPMFSTLLLRQDEIITGGPDNKGALGEPFFIFFMCLAVSFIIAAVLSTFISLAKIIIQNRKEYASSLLYVELNKIIKKYFYYYDNENENVKNKKFKLLEKYIFFYSNIDITSPNYNEYLHLFDVLNRLNCQCVLVFNEQISEEKQKLVVRDVIDKSTVEVIAFNKYKNSTNIKSLINLILYQITIVTGISSRLLIRQFPSFTNALYRFVDLSQTNEQLLRLLETLKTKVGKNQDIKIDSKYHHYFVDLFILSIIRSLDLNFYEQIYYEISTTCVLSHNILEHSLAQHLDLDEMFDANIKKYNKFSLLFEFNNFFNELQTLRDLIKNTENKEWIDLDKEEWKKKTIKMFEDKKYIQVENYYSELFDLTFDSSYGDLIYVKEISHYISSENTIASIKKLLQSSSALNIDYLTLEICSKRLTYELIDKKYELITDIFI